METDDWLWIGIAGMLLLVALNAFASAAETAVALARRARLLTRGEAAAQAAEQVLDDAERVFRTASILKALTRILTPLVGVWVAALALMNVMQPQDEGAINLPSIALPIFAVSVVAAMAFVPLVSELLPKSLATRRPDDFLLATAPAIRLLARMVSPLDWLVRAVGRRLAPGGTAAGASRAAHSEEQIKILVEGSAEEGVLEEDERDMIHSIFEFTDTVARKVMVPRIDMTCLQADTPIEEGLTVVLEEGHSRIPVFEETVDSILGIVHAKDLLQPLAEGRLSAALREFMRPPYFVPEGKRLDELLREMKADRIQMAIVVDEYGGTSGLVTIEDILEEIVGDIQDEYDTEEPEVVALDERTAVLDARMNIEDVNEQLGLSLPTEEFDSVGGFVFGLLGHVPAEGDHVRFDNLEFVIEKAGGNRIEKVRIIRGPAPSDVSPDDREPAPRAPENGA